MAESSEIRVGAVLGETYEITELLGQGGMGAVWAAKHLRLPGKRVAVKVLHGVAANDRESYARFRREAEIASRIGHPNIVTVHDFNVLPSGTPYLVLEFLEGEDLAQRLARGKVPLEQALNIARQIGSALHAAHKADVVHRDLKPGNVFLVPTEIGGELVDQVKVLDFGISKIRGSQTVQTQDSVLLGTPQYMAPEQALGKNAEIDARTDIFALGAIVYEMVAGTPAFMGATLAEVVFKVVYDKQPPLGGDVPRNVADAVEQALAKDPNQRFADVAAFINALTGRPLQTLDRMRAKNASPEAFASTQAPTPLSATPTPTPATTGARGELTPVIPPTQAAGARGGNKIVFGAVAVAVLALGALAVVKLTHPPAAPDTVEVPQVVPGAKIEVPEVVPGPKIEVPAPPTPPASHAPAMPPATAPPPTTAPSPNAPAVELHAATPKKEAPARHEALPPGVDGELTAAEALVGVNSAEAIRLARHTLTQAKTSRAFSIIARAYCKDGNLGDAKAALHSVTGGERARVLKYCKSVGTELE